MELQHCHWIRFLNNVMNLPKRKNIRLKGYDYSQNGLYFITICVKEKQEILWKHIIPNNGVGDGVLDVPNNINIVTNEFNIGYISSKHANLIINNKSKLSDEILSYYGLVIENIIEQINFAYKDKRILKYVIMPNHIHFILRINANHIKDGTSRTPSPTNAKLPQFVSTLKRMINKQIGFNIFQRSYHDHIIRNEKEYQVISKYICENPQKWEQDCYYPQNNKLEVQT